MYFKLFFSLLNLVVLNDVKDKLGLYRCKLDNYIFIEYALKSICLGVAPSSGVNTDLNFLHILTSTSTSLSKHAYYKYWFSLRE